MNQFKGSIALEHMHHAYAKTDGTYDFPNSREGDILRRCKKELEELIKRSDNSECNKENTMKKKSIKSTVKIPKGCECDNTHEQNQTVCRACWKVGLRFELSPY